MSSNVGSRRAEETEGLAAESSLPGTSTEQQVLDLEAHTCGGCKAHFTRIEHLRRHIVSIHSGQNAKPHTCQFCRKGFSRRDVLLRHHQSCRSAVAGSVLVSRRTKRACKICKELKLKCTGGPRCEKCKGLGHDCIFPEPRTQGRTPAIHQMPLSASPKSGDDAGANGDRTLGPTPRQDSRALESQSQDDVDVDYHHDDDVGSEKDVWSPWALESPPTERKTVSKRGRYVSKACINCQKRKVKCSGQEPCSHCRSGVLECVYRKTRKRRNIAAVIGSQHPETPEVTSVQEDEETLSAMNRLAKLEQEFRIFKQKSLIREQYVTQSRSDDSEDNHSDEGTKTPDYPTPSTVLDPKVISHGASSLYEPLRVLNGTVGETEVATTGDTALISWQNLQPIHKTDMRVLDKETRSDIPGLRHSIDVYFSYLNPHYPILNENQFRSAFEAFVNNTRPSHTAEQCQFVALVNLIHGIVKILHDNSMDPKIVPGWHEFCRSENILNQVLSFGGEGNLLTVQCLFLKSHYLLYLEKGDSAFDTMGRIIHLCFLLRLHNQAAWIGCSAYEIHMRQRIFWTIFNQDRILAINCGVPYILRESDFKVDFPRHFDDKMLSPDQPLPEEESIERSFSSYLFCAAKWGKMGAEIWDALFSVNAKKPTTRDSDFVITMDARILYTSGQFPPHLQWDRNVHLLKGSHDLPPAVFRQSLVLHLQMNQLRLHLRQEHMLTLKYDHNLAEECLQIATSSVNAIHAYYTSRYHKQSNRFSSILYLMGSLLILVSVIVKSDNDQQTRANAIDAFKRGLAMHNEMSTHYTMARHALQRMHLIISRTEQAINSFESAQQYPLEDLRPQITDFFNSEPSWMMDLDKDMIILPFNGNLGSSFCDGSGIADDMDAFWADDSFNARRALAHPP